MAEAVIPVKITCQKKKKKDECPSHWLSFDGQVESRYLKTVCRVTG